MFVPYSSDAYPEYRPWLAYLTFPAIVLLSFYLAGTEHAPSMDSINFGPMFRIAGVVLFFYMLWTFLVLWTLGKAVCSKIGNLRYIFGLFALFVLFAGISWIGTDSDLIWFLSWLVNGIAGLYLVFCPENAIDCFFFVPPFRGFSMTGYWFILIWLIVDFLFALLLGWYWACLLHPLAFVAGLVYGGLLLKYGRVETHPDERTLWQMITQKEPEDRFWKTSWSVRKQQQQEQETNQKQSDDHVRNEASKTDSPDPGKEGDLAILCECGRVVYVPAGAKGEGTVCPSCGHPIQPREN